MLWIDWSNVISRNLLLGAVGCIVFVLGLTMAWFMPSDTAFASRAISADAAFLPELEQLARDNPRFQLINVAQWESVDAFEAATARMRMESRAKPPAGLKANPALFQVIRE